MTTMLGAREPLTDAALSVLFTPTGSQSAATNSNWWLGTRGRARTVGSVVRLGNDEAGNKYCQTRMQVTETIAGESAHADIAETIKTHQVVLFMKGTPAHPQCGFSAAVVEVLRHYDVLVH